MFNFFRKSKKDADKKNKECQSVKEGASVVPIKNTIAANTIQKAEIAPESITKRLPNYSPESGLRKNVSNASSATGISLEKNDISIASPNPDIIATMCDKSVVSTKSDLIVPIVERRGSCVKPCGHGTTAVTPRIPVLTGSHSNNPSPSASPVLEFRKQFRITGIENLQNMREETPKMGRKYDTDADQEQNTVTASMKLDVSLPSPAEDNKIVENGVNNEQYVFHLFRIVLYKIIFLQN